MSQTIPTASMAWLICELTKGQFDTEVSVRLCDYNGEQTSLFVPNYYAKHDGPLGDEWTTGKLRVEILDSRDGFSLVYLPGKTFNNGQAITVSDQQLLFAESAAPLEAR